MRRRLLARCSSWTFFWCLCITATALFITSFVLSITLAKTNVQTIFALLAMLTTTAVQKLSVLEFVIILLHRRRSYCTIVLDAVLR
jgi:hypothetical protein